MRAHCDGRRAHGEPTRMEGIELRRPRAVHDFREAPSERSVRSRPPAPAANDPHEAEWVRRAVEGDGAAFAEIVRAYSTRIYSHLYGIVGNREDAEDLA